VSSFINVSNESFTPPDEKGVKHEKLRKILRLAKVGIYLPMRMVALKRLTSSSFVYKRLIFLFFLLKAIGQNLKLLTLACELKQSATGRNGTE
jgi:hypothetical protein